MSDATEIQAGPSTTYLDRTPCPARRHGDETAYSWWHCRCADAREAWRIYQTARRHGTNTPAMIPAGPTATRLRILAGAGHDWRSVGRAAGWSAKRMTDLARMRTSHIHRNTAARVAHAYNQLINAPQPYGYAASRAISNATKAGWGLVDLEAVHQTLAGRHVALTRMERAAVVYTGAAQGLPAHTLARAARLSHTAVLAKLAA